MGCNAIVTDHVICLCSMIVLFVYKQTLQRSGVADLIEKPSALALLILLSSTNFI